MASSPIAAPDYCGMSEQDRFGLMMAQFEKIQVSLERVSTGLEQASTGLKKIHAACGRLSDNLHQREQDEAVQEELTHFLLKAFDLFDEMPAVNEASIAPHLPAEHAPYVFDRVPHQLEGSFGCMDSSDGALQMTVNALALLPGAAESLVVGHSAVLVDDHIFIQYTWLPRLGVDSRLQQPWPPPIHWNCVDWRLHQAWEPTVHWSSTLQSLWSSGEIWEIGELNVYTEHTTSTKMSMLLRKWPSVIWAVQTAVKRYYKFQIPAPDLWYSPVRRLDSSVQMCASFISNGTELRCCPNFASLYGILELNDETVISKYTWMALTQYGA